MSDGALQHGSIRVDIRSGAEAGQEAAPVGGRVPFGKAYAEILRVAQDQGGGLLVLGARGRGAVDLALFGSTTNQVVRGAACPVLSVRED